jgi:cellobiose phosphorylase
VKENSGIFLQSQGWIILAEALMGNGDQAYSYYKESCPAAQNDIAEIRKLEPYCYGQFTEGKSSAHFGRSQVHWLTGTASTVMVGAVEGILGLRPDPDGLRIAPSVPHEWDQFEIVKTFRGCRLHITVENPGHVQSGCRSLELNGKKLPGDYIPAEELKEENEVRLVLG